jgi:hypothetical protein
MYPLRSACACTQGNPAARAYFLTTLQAAAKVSGVLGAVKNSCGCKPAGRIAK